MTKLAKIVENEDPKAFIILVVEHGRTAGLLVSLLTRKLGVSKKQITQLGYTASDEQNDSILQKRNRVVIVPEDILIHRPCTFYPPSGTTQVTIIQGSSTPIEVKHRDCTDNPFQLLVLN